MTQHDVFVFDEYEYAAYDLLDDIVALTISLHMLNTRMDDNELIELIEGLETLRKQYHHPVDGDWGLVSFSLCEDSIPSPGEITEKGLNELAGYIMRDSRLRSLSLSGALNNKIMHNLDTFIQSINSSSLTTIHMRNTSLGPAAAISHFAGVCPKFLHSLDLMGCDFGGFEVVDAIIAFLVSPRSRSLTFPSMQDVDIGTGLGEVGRIIDAIELRNFTLTTLNIQFDKLGPHIFHQHYGSVTLESVSHLSRDEMLESYREYQRLERCLERNAVLTKRVCGAALRCLSIARIILNGISLYATPSPTQQHFELNGSEPTTAVTGNTTPRIRLLDLPTDLIDLIVRHTSGDPTALSHAQYARIRIEASGKEGLRRMMRASQDGLTARYAIWGDAKVGSKEEWLQPKGLNRWENDVSSLSDAEGD